MDFYGEARPLIDADFDRAAHRLHCEVASVRAVAEVESGGRTGFLPDGRPKILFESRWFHNLTGGRFDAEYPDISTPRWVRNYRGGGAEYDRLQQAMALDRDAALKSASWGMFQVLGVNHRIAGFEDIASFVAAHCRSEGDHLDGFTGFVIANRLDDELRDKRWADFARGYNGAGYAVNRYDVKLAEAYARHAAGRIVPSTLDVQRALNARGATLVADGKSGPDTKAAIRAFQDRVGLPITGFADAATLDALGLSEFNDPVELSARLNG